MCYTITLDIALLCNYYVQLWTVWVGLVMGVDSEGDWINDFDANVFSKSQTFNAC